MIGESHLIVPSLSVEALRPCRTQIAPFSLDSQLYLLHQVHEYICASRVRV
jgi:hypothetical protein